MEKRFKEILKKYLTKEKLVLAVSGGVDSVVLFDLFIKNYPPGQLIVAHIDHGLREDTKKEKDLVERLAISKEIPFYWTDLKLKKAGEELARIKRYQFLREVKDKTKSDFIVTAHHLNDQAETVLLSLTRGSGPIEIWGMKKVENDLFRPLLTFSKKEIQSYANQNKLKFVEDPSNKDLKYSRNRIRAKVLPELEKINPQFLKSIERTVTLGNEGAKILTNEVKKYRKKVKTNNHLSVAELLKTPQFIQKELIKNELKIMTQKEDISSTNVEKVLDLTQKTGEKKTEIGPFTVIKSYDKITFAPSRERLQKKGDLTVGGKTLFNGFVLTVQKKAGKPRKNNILLPQELAYNLEVRSWKNGDKIKTFSGTKKVQDLFTDAKIPKKDRQRWPIVVAKNEILWIPLLAASTKALKESKKEVLVIEVKNEN